MPTIKWSDEAMSVGIKGIDEQHKKLLDLINALEGHGGVLLKPEMLAKAISEMSKYASIHFSYEEQLMRQHKYPGLDEQIASHAAFIKKVADLQGRAPRADAQFGAETRLYLRDWLVRHIQVTDRRYSTFFSERGVK